MNNEFHFNIPIDKPKAKNTIANTIKNAQKHIDTAIHQQRKDWPEYMVLKVYNIYSDNTFDLITPDEEHLFERVSAVDPRAKDFYQRGKAVTVRFNNVNGGRPYIKFGYGFMSTPVDITPQPTQTIRFWTQSKASWLQNQHAPEACQLYSPWDSSGTDIYTFYSKDGDTFLGDPRGRPYGLVSFRDAGENPRLAVAYMVFSSDGSFTKYHKIDVIDLSGSLIHQYSFDSTAVYPFGNFTSYGQFSINPVTLQFTLIPSYGTEYVIHRAWDTSGSYHTDSTVLPTPYSPYSPSFAKHNILFYNYLIDYTPGGASITAHVWPLTPFPESITVHDSIQGFSVTSNNVLLNKFTLSPTTLRTSSATNVWQVSGSFTESIPPASIQGDYWYLASVENTVVGSLVATDAGWAALENQYSSVRPSSFVVYGSSVRSSKLNITKLSAADGSKAFVYSITCVPRTPVVAEGILAAYEAYLQDVIMPAYRGWSGRVTEASRNQLSLASYDRFVWPPSDMSYPPSMSFSWPRYDYMPRGITMMPQVANNIRSGRAAGSSTPYYNGQLDSMISITDYVNNNISYNNSNSIYSDPNGNIYFTYIEPYPFLTYGRLMYDLPEDPYLTGSYNVYLGHMPSLAYSILTTQVCLTSSGALKWKRDLTQWSTYTTWFETADFTVVGGNTTVSLPVPNNVFLQVPCSRYLLVVREIRGLGSEYRPDMWLEVVNIEDGNTVQFIYLPLAFDTLVADVDDGATPVANAGERNYAVADVKIKTATRSDGTDWCVVWTKHYTRDGTTIAGTEDHIDLYMAPTDGTIGEWSAVGSWVPNYAGGDHAPTGDFWDTVCVSDGSMHWIEGQFYGPDFKWQVYKRDL